MSDNKIKNLDTKNKIALFSLTYGILILLFTYIPPSFFYILNSSLSKYTFFHISLTCILFFSTFNFIKKKNIKFYWALLLSICTIASSLFILITNKISSGEPKANMVKVISKSYSYSSKSRRKDYYVKVTSWRNTNEIELIYVNFDVWNATEINSNHVVKIKKGIFGLESNAGFY